MVKMKVKEIVELWHETQLGCMHKCLKKQHEFSDVMWGLYEEMYDPITGRVGENKKENEI